MKFKQMSKEEALNKAASYCTLCERCTHEVRSKLQSWGVSAGDTAEIIDHLIDEKFIDEVRYCHAFANDKVRFNHWGRMKIAAALREKRLPSTLITEAIDAINPDEYRDALQSVIESKRRELKGADDYAAKTKIIRHAAGRGFEPSLIMKQLNFQCDEID